MLKFLIVDDDQTNCRLLTSYLKGYGEFEVAANGYEALEAVKHSLDIADPFDLICLDIMMPMMDGNETLREIRNMEYEAQNSGICDSSAKILMTTAVGDIKTVLQSYNDLCDGYLQKPIKKEKLLKVLGELGVL